MPVWHRWFKVGAVLNCWCWPLYRIKHLQKEFVERKPVVPNGLHVSFFSCLWPEEDPTVTKLIDQCLVNHAECSILQKSSKSPAGPESEPFSHSVSGSSQSFSSSKSSGVNLSPGFLLSLEVGRAMLTWTHWHAHIMNPLFHTRSNPFSWCFTLPGITPALGSSCSVDQIQNMGYFRNRLGYYLFSFHKFPAPVVFSFEYPRIRLLAPAELVLFVS